MWGLGCKIQGPWHVFGEWVQGLGSRVNAYGFLSIFVRGGEPATHHLFQVVGQD